MGFYCLHILQIGKGRMEPIILPPLTADEMNAELDQDRKDSFKRDEILSRRTEREEQEREEQEGEE